MENRDNVAPQRAHSPAALFARGVFSVNDQLIRNNSNLECSARPITIIIVWNETSARIFYGFCFFGPFFGEINNEYFKQ